jgi:hypothetical protein
MYDIVFISYNEPNADENFNNLKSRFQIARRIHGVTGIHQAHKAAAKISLTKMFWVVDGDAKILPDFDFSFVPDKWNKETVHVWRSQNPVNRLVYGYGGVKLFPRSLAIKMNTETVDMTTSISSNFKVMDKISNITEFNTDPFNTWKSAFRECVKLSSKIIDNQENSETTERLEVWCKVGNDKPYGKYSIIGANQGKEFGINNKNNAEKLKLINNFEWLNEQFSKNSV